jgi:hypothetical protein
LYGGMHPIEIIDDLVELIPIPKALPYKIPA